MTAPTPATRPATMTIRSSDCCRTDKSRRRRSTRSTTPIPLGRPSTTYLWLVVLVGGGWLVVGGGERSTRSTTQHHADTAGVRGGGGWLVVLVGGWWLVVGGGWLVVVMMVGDSHGGKGGEGGDASEMVGRPRLRVVILFVIFRRRTRPS